MSVFVSIFPRHNQIAEIELLISLDFEVLAWLGQRLNLKCVDVRS
jgi:hypothetical protein